MKLPFPQEIICAINKYSGSPTASLVPPYRQTNVNWDKYDKLLHKYRTYRMLCYKHGICISSFQIFNDLLIETKI